MCRRVCDFLTGDRISATIALLCEHPNLHLSRLLSKLPWATTDEDTSPRSSADGEQTNRVLERCVVAMEGATHVLVERHYFDVDHRSNVGLLIGDRHQSLGLNAERLVFLRSSHPTNVKRLTGIEGLNLIDAAVAVGYIILPGNSTNVVGRSLIPAPRHLPMVKNSVDVRKHVRTSVLEVISVLGRLKQVTGIPFMQQDGHLLQCAHVAAWMVHYAAVLRGLTSRRRTAEFHTASKSGISRRYPSGGLTAQQIIGILDDFGLPGEHVNAFDINYDRRSADWYDRSAIRRLSEDMVRMSGSVEVRAQYRALYALAHDKQDEVLSDGAEALLRSNDAFWDIERLTRTVTQYLNSGFPCILLTLTHAVAVVGYLRARDLVEDPLRVVDEYRSESDVTSFICADPERGPFEILSVAEIYAKLVKQKKGVGVIIPLPRAVWMSASAAETLGALFFRSDASLCAEKIVTNAREALQIRCTPVQRRRVVVELEEFFDASSDMSHDAERYALRSYVVPSTDFKNGFARRRANDPEAVQQVRLSSLPKYVWVVEVMDRRPRRRRQSSVIGEVVLDATDTNVRTGRALIVHLPGAIQTYADGSQSRWTITGVTQPYRSGRYHGRKDWLADTQAIAERSKG